MERLPEMLKRLEADGADLDNPPIGFIGGPDLPYLKGKEMHCTGVTCLAQLQGDKIVEFDKHLPYGFLHIGGDDLPSNSTTAIINKLDFKNAWTINEKGWFEDDEYMVFLAYKPASGLLRFISKALPTYEFSIVGPVKYTRIYGLETFEDEI